MLVILLLLALFVPALCFRSSVKIPNDVQMQKAIAPLLLGALIAGAISLVVGVYTFLQMRKMQKKNQPKPNQLDGTIADEGISFYDLAGSPHVHTNITDIWDKTSQAIKKKSGGFLGMGKTSQVTGYRYYAKFAAFIGNRIEKFLAINFDNRGWIVHDPLKHPPNLLPVSEGNLFGEDEGGVPGTLIFILAIQIKSQMQSIKSISRWCQAIRISLIWFFAEVLSLDSTLAIQAT